MNLIPDALSQAAFSQAISDVHDTFSRPIIVWKHSAQNISPLNPSFDAFYDNPKKDNIVYTTQSTTVMARIKYLDRQDKDFALAIASRANQIELTQETQILRIKVKIADSPIIDDATKITVEGIDYSVLSSPTDHGVINFEYATFYLRLYNL